MTILDAEYTHAAKAREALDRLKALATEPIDLWECVSKKDATVKLYRKGGEDPYKHIPFVRGETVLKTTEFTPNDVATVATLPGCRTIWDEKFDSHKVIDMKTRWEALFWVKVKAPWPISPRDFAGVSLRDVEDDECYVVMASVEDKTIPEISGCVRAKLIISGWRMKKVREGVAVTYITQVDLAGSIPTRFVDNVQQQVPLCAGEVAKYVTTYGIPPIPIKVESVRYAKEEFDHAKRTHTVDFKEGESGECQWRINKKMFPHGVEIEKVDSSEGTIGEVQVSDQADHQVVTLTAIQGSPSIVLYKKKA